MNPTVPLGIPHRLTENDIYRDFYVPAGTTVFANIQCALIYLYLKMPG